MQKRSVPAIPNAQIFPASQQSSVATLGAGCSLSGFLRHRYFTEFHPAINWLIKFEAYFPEGDCINMNLSSGKLPKLVNTWKKMVVLPFNFIVFFFNFCKHAQIEPKPLFLHVFAGFCCSLELQTGTNKIKWVPCHSSRDGVHIQEHTFAFLHSKLDPVGFCKGFIKIWLSAPVIFAEYNNTRGDRSQCWPLERVENCRARKTRTSNQSGRCIQSARMYWGYLQHHWSTFTTPQSTFFHSFLRHLTALFCLSVGA